MHTPEHTLIKPTVALSVTSPNLKKTQMSIKSTMKNEQNKRIHSYNGIHYGQNDMNESYNVQQKKSQKYTIKLDSYKFQKQGIYE